MDSGDYLTAQHFKRGNLWEKLSFITVSVVVIDRIWQTQLYRQRGADEQISINIQKNWEKIRDTLKKLDTNSLKEYPNNVYESAKLVVLIIMNKTERLNYVFATKFLHWYCPEVFPIVDSNARRGIREFQEENEVQKQNVISDTGPASKEGEKLADYKKFVFFYSDLLRTISKNEKEDIIQFDFDSQNPEELRIKNTVLRIFDKHFFTKGVKKKIKQ